MTRMLYKFSKILFFSGLLILVLSGGYASGQSKPYNEEITVIAAFDPIIPDAFKINQNPVLTDTTLTVPSMTYTVTPRNAGIQLDIDPLPAVKLVAEPLSKLYRNYLKAGVGNYASLYGELFASSLRSKTSLFGIHLSHLSYSGEIKNYSPSANSSQLAEIFGQQYFDHYTLSGKIFFKRDGLHLYGFKPSEFPLVVPRPEGFKQHYLTSGAEVGLGSRYKNDDKLNHTLGLSFYHLSDLFDVKENNILFSAKLDKQYDLFNWEKPQIIGVNTSLNFLNQSDSISKINATVLGINPTISARLNEYSFKAGLLFDFGIDTLTKAHVYPMLEANIDLIPGALQLYAGIDGGMERNSIRNLSEVNPYITSGLKLDYTYNRFRAYGGFTSNISRTFNFNGSISSTSFENYPLFITDYSTDLHNTFTLVYDDINVVKVNAELEFIKADKLRLSLAGHFYRYNLEEQEYAWFKPDYDLDFTANYNFQNKITFKFQTKFNGPVWAYTRTEIFNPQKKSPTIFREEPQKIKGWVDINLGAEYKFNKALTFWLNLNNLANTQHFNWINYPSYRLNAMAGLSYSF